MPVRSFSSFAVLTLLLALVLLAVAPANALPVRADPAPDDVRAEMSQHWTDLGGAAGPLGEPAGEPFAITGGYRWDFAGGSLFRADPPEGQSATVSAVLGTTLQRYDEYGGPAGPLGYPKGDPAALANGASAQEFGHGNIYTSRATGAHEVVGAILGRYLTQGGPARLGLPTTGETDVPGVTGARQNIFQRGRIYWSPRTGAHEVLGAILGRYLTQGGPTRLGLPTTGETDVPGVTGARQNIFQRGRIYWSPRTGAHEVLG
ncbi:MAG TPA: hypothetical protein VFO98_14515, partial [Marmoricola sp.]|nr:hypothetical protein [Marmoricola sp.]